MLRLLRSAFSDFFALPVHGTLQPAVVQLCGVRFRSLLPA